MRPKYFLTALTLIANFALGLNIDSSHVISRGPASDERVKNIAENLNTVFSCPERVWPGLKKQDFRILFTQPTNKRAWFYQAVSGKVDILSEEEFSNLRLDDNRYSFSTFRGDRVVIVNLERVSQNPTIAVVPVDAAVNTAFHEGFHFLFQMKAPWTAHFSATERNKNVEHIEALYMRRMLISALKGELNTNQGFGKSAYWLKKWKLTGESNETKFNDIIEGTAFYAENVATIVASEGCQVSEENIISVLKSNVGELVDKPLNANLRKEFFREYLRSGYQTESYEIGLMSLIAIRASGKLIGARDYEMGRDFMDEIQKASTNQEKLRISNELLERLTILKTPAELLLNDVIPVADSEKNSVKLEILESAK